MTTQPTSSTSVAPKNRLSTASTSNVIDGNPQESLLRNKSRTAIDPLCRLKIIKPEHANAHRALLFKSVSQNDKIFAFNAESINVKADSQYTVKMNLNNISKNRRQLISNHVAYYLNNPSKKPVMASDIREHVCRELEKANLERPLHSNEITFYYLWLASVIGKNLRDGYDKQKLQNKIYNHVLKLQHCGFLNKVPWVRLKAHLKEALIQKFAVEHPFGKANAQDTLSTITKEIENARGYDSTKFKAYKHTNTPRMRATQIRSLADPNKIFALIKTPTDEQMQHIRSKADHAKQVRILGEGAFGSVKYGIDLENMDVIAVKELLKREAANCEIKQFQRVGKGDHLISMRGYAHCFKQDRSAQSINKSYIFMDYAGNINGNEAIDRLEEKRKTNPDQAEKARILLAKHYTRAVAELHQNQMYHHDIKPTNFVHSAQQPYLVDYGLSDAFRRTTHGGTPRFKPPEYGTHGYRSDKHDAFSLGITLLCLKHGKHPHEMNAGHLDINGATVDLAFKRESGRLKNSCYGTNNTSALEGKTLDEVLAKLLDRSPEMRITPIEALQLPFFNESGDF